MNINRLLALASRVTPVGWALITLPLGGLFAYSASVAWGDQVGSPSVRLSVALLGLLLGVAARRANARVTPDRGSGWNELGRVLRDWWHWMLHRELTASDLAMMMCVVLYAAGSVIYWLPRWLKPERGARSRTVWNMKRCGLALLQYTQDYNNTMPPRRETCSMGRYLSPYLHYDRTLLGDSSAIPFAWCQRLSGLYIGDIRNASSIIVAHSSKPVATDGEQEYLALFLDGHTEMVPESRLAHRLAVAIRRVPGKKHTKP